MDDTKFAVNNHKGVTIVCTNERWDNHIASHEVMKNNSKAVKDTVKDPESVYKSAEYDNREVYFKASSYSTYKLKTKVVVEYSESKNGNVMGEVVTAFPSKDERGNIGENIYRKPEN